MSDAAMSILRAIVVLNVHNALVLLRTAQRAKTLTAAKLQKLSKGWTLCLPVM
jgi:hypothetical protein